MLADELPAEGFLALREVVKVGAGVARAGRARAVGIEWVVRAFVNPAPELQESARGERPAALGDLGGDDAIEHVDPAMDGFENIERRSNAHEVAGFVLRQERCREFTGVLALAFALTHGKTAYRVAVERHRAQRLGAFFPEVQMQRTLDDGEHGLSGISPRGEAASGPAVGELHRGAGSGFIDRGGNALVEDHHDIAADGDLRFDAALGAEKNRATVQVALENGTLLGHRARVGEGKNLEASRVGEDRALPAHEFVDAADLPENLGAGTEQEVVGIRKEDLGARVVEKIGRLRLDRRVCADGHEQRGFHLVVERAKSRRAGAGVARAGL